MFLIITACTAKKDDSIPIISKTKIVEPSYYLDRRNLISELCKIRDRIFQDPQAQVGTKITTAFDLYVRAGKAYKKLWENNYKRLKSQLFSSQDIEWFFLSGGYGIIHALEEAKRYQATFNRNISYQKGIPYTANLWRKILPLICESIIKKFNPEWIYVFGSRDYTVFIKQTDFWRQMNNVKIIESTGSAGPSWLSPILNELVNSILDKNLRTFNQKYKLFVKQP